MSGEEVAIYQPQSPGEILSDDEIRRLYRMAEALAKGRMFADVNQAEQAFSKMLIGHYLGLNPAQSMLNLHIVKGNVQFRYTFFSTLIRSHVGYDFKILKHEDDHAEVEFLRDGESLGTAKFSVADAKRANLIKDKGGWETYPENMCVARALSKGCRFFMGEVLGGIPVYALGEIPEAAELTAGEGDGSAPGINLGPKVDAVLERAAELGVEALAHRPTVEMQLGKRSPDTVNAWVRNATAQLDHVETEMAKRESVAKAEEIPDVEVVDWTGEERGEAEERRESDSPASSEEDHSAEHPVPAEPSPSAPSAEPEPDQRVLRLRLEGLQYRRQNEALTEPQMEELDAEIDQVEGELRALGAEVPGQESLLS